MSQSGVMRFVLKARGIDLLWTLISSRGNECEDTQPSPCYRALVAICYVTPYIPAVILR